MNYSRILHFILGLLPFLWFVVFLLILTIGSIDLGYIPTYGNGADPYSLNLNLLSTIHTLLAIGAYFSFYGWIGLTLILGTTSRRFLISKASCVLFVIGVAGYFVFKYIFSQHYLWVFD